MEAEELNLMESLNMPGLELSSRRHLFCNIWRGGKMNISDPDTLHS